MIVSHASVAISIADLDAAVAAGVIDRAAADRLLIFTKTTATPGQADEENLRLITGFNDIFVTTGLALFLGALTYMASNTGAAITGLVVGAASWALAEVFTRRKRQALPSIALLAVYAVSAFIAAISFLTGSRTFTDAIDHESLLMAVAGLIAAALIGIHWLRFRVPITIAAGCAALVIAIISSAASLEPDFMNAHPVVIFLPLGLAVFALAMRFDMSDRARLTRHTDIAFWLHLLAAPLIVHPIVTEAISLGDMTTADAGIILALFAVLSLVALAIDRRALLVSTLIYLGYAAYTLISATAWGSSTYALAVMAVGGTVLILSVAWRPLRRLILNLIPLTIQAHVPEPS